MTATHGVLKEQLRTLGVGPGALLMVHASMRKVGPVVGRAAGLIDVILDLIGTQGTMMMVLGADPKTPFDAHESRVEVDEMGVLPEVFRKHPGIRVNDHAAARFAAHGPLAALLIDEPPLHDYHGVDSPLARFAVHGGQVLRLGADIDTVTLTHWAEYCANVPSKRRIRVQYERADTGVQWIECLDDNEGIREWSEGDYFSQILIDFIASGAVCVGPVGRCGAELFDGSAFVRFAVEWMERNLGGT